MMQPGVDDVLASIIATFEHDIAPLVHDEYAASLCLTVSQLLRSVRSRVAKEGDALYDDNAELRALLASVRPRVPPAEAGQIDGALAWTARPGYLSVHQLQDEATALRTVLAACIAALPDRRGDARAEVRAYLERQLRRQRPWLVDAFTGPRR